MPGAEERNGRGLLFNGYRVSVRENEKVLERIVVLSGEVLNAAKLHTLKWLRCIF